MKIIAKLLFMNGRKDLVLRVCKADGEEDKVFKYYEEQMKKLSPEDKVFKYYEEQMREHQKQGPELNNSQVWKLFELAGKDSNQYERELNKLKDNQLQNLLDKYKKIYEKISKSKAGKRLAKSVGEEDYDSYDYMVEYMISLGPNYVKKFLEGKAATLDLEEAEGKITYPILNVLEERGIDEE